MIAGSDGSTAVTLKEVAAAAGVSRSTASRALSGSALIAPATRLTVQEAAERLGYRPNRAASSLRSKQSHLIGLVLNNLINASFHTIAEVVQRRASTEGYQVILCITDADAHTERSFLDMLADHGVDGLIMIGSGQNAAVSNRMYAHGTALVNVIRAPDGGAPPSVLAADREGAFTATTHLIDLGHRRIGFIGGPAGTNSGDERHAGYVQALREAGHALDEGLVRQGPFTADFGVRAVTSLLAENPPMSALLAANHEAVFGILPTLVAEHVQVPENLSLICYEDISWLRSWQPPITVVDNGAAELGALAIDLLLQQMGARRQAGSVPSGRHGRTYRVGAQLIERHSCRRAPGLTAGG
jgi:LacI family transcriptional regulator